MQRSPYSRSSGTAIQKRRPFGIFRVREHSVSPEALFERAKHASLAAGETIGGASARCKNSTRVCVSVWQSRNFGRFLAHKNGSRFSPTESSSRSRSKTVTQYSFRLLGIPIPVKKIRRRSDGAHVFLTKHNITLFWGKVNESCATLRTLCNFKSEKCSNCTQMAA